MTKGFFQKFVFKSVFKKNLSNENLPNFDMKNMIFNVFKNIFNDFSRKKMAQICQISKEKKILNCQIFCDKFQ